MKPEGLKRCRGIHGAWCKTCHPDADKAPVVNRARKRRARRAAVVEIAVEATVAQEGSDDER